MDPFLLGLPVMVLLHFLRLRPLPPPPRHPHLRGNETNNVEHLPVPTVAPNQVAHTPHPLTTTRMLLLLLLLIIIIIIIIMKKKKERSVGRRAVVVVQVVLLPPHHHLRRHLKRPILYQASLRLKK